MDADEVVDGTIEPDVPATAVVPFAPAAGEVIDLSDRKRVAHTIAELDEWIELVLKPLLARLDAALIEEADTLAAYTLRFGKVTVKVDGPDVSRYEWADDLRPMLAELLAAGLPAERCNDVAAEQTTWKVNRSEVNKLRKVKRYRDIIDRYQTRQPRTRSVKVTRG